MPRPSIAYAQRNISAAGLEITIDQWLVLRTLQENPGIKLTTIAVDNFKDVASISRIVQVLEKKGYINGTDNAADGRRSSFSLSRTGSAAVSRFLSIVDGNRSHALEAEHRFIQQLLSDPRLPKVVDDIAVEFGNLRYQGMIDRYVAGENVPVDSLRLAWRNTTQPLAWDRPSTPTSIRPFRESTSNIQRVGG